MARYGILIDLNRCTGCMTCVIACKQENLTLPGVWWNKVLELENESSGRIIYCRYACMHCDHPPCVAACPSHAIYKREDGIVLIDQEKCNGTGDCVTACPYGAITINPYDQYFSNGDLPYQENGDAHRRHLSGKASMCTLCVHRIEQGKDPACVAGCPSKAMIFGDLDDPHSPIRGKFPESRPLLAFEGTRPGVFYLNSGRLHNQLEQRIQERPELEKDR